MKQASYKASTQSAKVFFPLSLYTTILQWSITSPVPLAMSTL